MMKFEYAPAPESTAIVDIQSEYNLFIDGKFVPSKGGKRFETINPSNEKVLSRVTQATSADVDKAVKAATEAYRKTWSKLTGTQRGKYLLESPEFCRREPANLRCLNRWITVNRFERLEILIFLSQRLTFSIMLVGLTNLITQALVKIPSHMVWWVR